MGHDYFRNRQSCCGPIMQLKPVVPTFIPIRIFLTTTGAGTWTVPADWNNTNNTIEVIGGGGGSSYSNNGGGGGAYSSISNLTLTKGASISYNVGAGGLRADQYADNAQGGGDTWLGNSAYASSNVAAKGGKAGWGQSNNNGGQSSLGIGSIKYSGGGMFYGEGGGGAAGSHGNGNDAFYGNGGAGDAGFGGAGGAGSGSPAGSGGNGTEWDATHGSGGGGGGANWNAGSAGIYGGGGGAGYSYGYMGTSGGQGIIVITYLP